MTIQSHQVRSDLVCSTAECLKLSRAWAMPNKNTFSIKPVREFIDRHLTAGTWIDPFANVNRIASITNDLDPQHKCDYQLDAIDFLKQFDSLYVEGILFDPPYSPRQVSESYRALGRTVNMETTQATYWSALRRKSRESSSPAERSSRLAGIPVASAANMALRSSRFGWWLSEGWHNRHDLCGRKEAWRIGNRCRFVEMGKSTSMRAD